MVNGEAPDGEGDEEGEEQPGEGVAEPLEHDQDSAETELLPVGTVGVLEGVNAHAEAWEENTKHEDEPGHLFGGLNEGVHLSIQKLNYN